MNISDSVAMGVTRKGFDVLKSEVTEDVLHVVVRVPPPVSDYTGDDFSSILGAFYGALVHDWSVEVDRMVLFLHPPATSNEYAQPALRYIVKTAWIEGFAEDEHSFMDVFAYVQSTARQIDHDGDEHDPEGHRLHIDRHGDLAGFE